MTITARRQLEYSSSAIRQLRDQILADAPQTKYLEFVDRAERLILELDPRGVYETEFFYQRLVGQRPFGTKKSALSGKEARRDLQILIQELSGMAGVSVQEAGESVLSIRDVAKLLNVSTKTISRWRRQGLVSRRFVFNDRKQLGFLRSSVERFVAKNRRRVERGTRFTQMTAEERQTICDQAARMAAAGVWPAELTKQLARLTGRSLETIRYTLKRFDREHPEQAVFPDHYGSLPLETKRSIYRMFQCGEPTEALARRFGRTKSSIYRILAEMRARRILDLPLDFVANSHFELIFRDKVVERDVIDSPPESREAMGRSRPPAGLPPYLASLYEVPLLTREQETHLFRKMNYLKYKACRLRERLSPGRRKKGLMAQIERLYEEIVATKNHIIRANLRLVVSIAKRHMGPAQNFFELVSDGNVSLMRAVERFDFALENRFSTYASWAIMKNFARTIPESLRQKDRFRTSHPDLFPSTEDARTDQHELEAVQSQREAAVQQILRRLDKREQEIITCRFGLRRGQEALTLKQVGAALGVTKERIRQIEARALNKLRAAVGQQRHSLLD